MTTFERFERAIPELMTELSPARVPEDLPGRIHALHLFLVAGNVRVEDLGEDSVGSLDHQLVCRRVHLQDAVMIGSRSVHGGSMGRVHRAVRVPRVRSGAVRTASSAM